MRTGSAEFHTSGNSFHGGHSSVTGPAHSKKKSCSHASNKALLVNSFMTQGHSVNQVNNMGANSHEQSFDNSRRPTSQMSSGYHQRK